MNQGGSGSYLGDPTPHRIHPQYHCPQFKKGNQFFRLISDNHVDGVAVLGRCGKQLLTFLKQYFKYDQIICDGHQATITAIDHLVQLGHTKIAYIGETKQEDRYQH